MPAKRRKRKKNNQFAFSTLEPKKLLAGITFDSATGVVTVEGSSSNDQVQVIQDVEGTKVVYHGNEIRQFAHGQISEVVFFANAGDDWFRNRSNLPTRIYGQAGDDVLVGGSRSDRLYGGPGNDFLIGGNGDDYLAGSGGNDKIRGIAGLNTLIGGDDADDIIGGNDRDIILGQGGDDSLHGLDGDDYLSGGAGDDLFGGQSGNDRIIGGDGVDRAWGGDGDDNLSGGKGNDRLFGNDGDDSMHGDDDSDHLRGGNGRDRIFGDLGNDILFGDGDDDTILGHDGNDLIWGGSGNDSIYGSNGADYLSGDDGHDSAYAGNGDDIIRGGSGRDQLFGQSGRDQVFGDLGNDDLDGGSDSDRLFGGQGNDDFSRDDSDSVFSDDDDFNANDDFEIRGTIENLDTANRTFELLGITVDYSIAFVQGNIAEGKFVKAEGAYDQSSLLAKEVEPELDDRQENIEAIGVITNLNTSAQTFSLLGFNVSYANARIDGSISESGTIELEGRYDGNGNINALRIDSSNDAGGNDGNDNGNDDNNGDRPTNGALELRGPIVNLNTSAQTFSVLGVTVDYSNARVFGQLSNGGLFKVDGSYNGTLLAREVETETPDDDRDENVRASGTVENLDVQSQTFTLLGFTVDFSGAEIDDAFSEGDIVEVDGWFANGNISAEEIGA